MFDSRVPIRVSKTVSAFLLGFTVVCWAPPCAAQSAQMLQELAPGSRPGAGGDVDEMVALGDEMVFVWQGEPWITDGTPEGTRWIKDINPGVGNWSRPHDFIELDGGLLFSAADDVDWGVQLWRTDGTDEGTWMIADLCPACWGGSVNHLTRMGDRVYFTAPAEGFGIELWSTDGTPDGTQMVSDIWPGSLSSRPWYLAELDGRLLFSAEDPLYGLEPWVSNGTAGGTEPLADIAPGQDWSRPYGLTVANDLVFFRAGNDRVGGELWCSDGTPAGTRMVADIAQGSASSSPDAFGVLDDELVFQAFHPAVGRELWRSDGTTSGTAFIADINPLGDSNPRGFFEFDGHLFFSADDGVHGNEPWLSDGTLGGTSMLIDIQTGAGDSRPWDFVEFDNRLWFSAMTDGDFGQLWLSNGTAAGTKQVSDFQYLGPYGLLNLGPAGSNGVYFTTYGTWSSTAELWRTDQASPNGLKRVATTDRPRPLLVEPPVAIGHRIFIAADDGEHGYELYVHEPGHGVRMLGDINPGDADGVHFTYHGRIAGFDGWTYFGATTPDEGSELWRTDGTVDGTEIFLDIRPGPDSSSPDDMVVMGPHLYFVARGADTDRGIWRTDGTVAGTEPVVVIGHGGFSSDANVVAVLGDQIFFSARESTTVPTKLWVTNGTAAETTLVETIVASWAKVAVGRLFFSGSRSGDGPEPWVSDGSTAGTFKLADITPGGDGSFPRGFLELAGEVIFFVADWNEWGLWKTDGTPQGTVEILKQSFVPGGAGVYGSLDPENMVVYEGLVFFTARDESHGVELWRTDGTPEGTRMVRDIRPGSRGSVPTGLTVSGGRLWFSATEGDHGIELWTSDGTTTGTRLAVDIAPGSFSSEPQALVDRGGTLLFLAENMTHGFELWLAGDWLFADGFEIGSADAWANSH